MIENEQVIVLEVDAITGEQSSRFLTAEEIAERGSITDEQLELQQAIADKIAARESALAKLAALGLTEEEIAAL
jgi:DNA-binding NarL/FixJ family response regulator